MPAKDGGRPLRAGRVRVRYSLIPAILAGTTALPLPGAFAVPATRAKPWTHIANNRLGRQAKVTHRLNRPRLSGLLRVQRAEGDSRRRVLPVSSSGECLMVLV